MKGHLRILLIEDSETDAALVEFVLKDAGFRVELERVETASEMRAALERKRFDAVLSDWSLPRFSGAHALKLFAELGLDQPFIIVSGAGGEEHAVEAMRAGAHDYVLKDRLARLVPALERELGEAEARRRAQKIDTQAGPAIGTAYDGDNLLSVVLGTCELMLSDLSVGDAHRDSLENLHAAAERAAGLTPAAVSGPAHPSSDPRSLATVLLVEADVFVRKVACALLQREGYVVLQAETGAAALELCAAHAGAIDLLLGDATLGRTSGPELPSELAALRPSLRVALLQKPITRAALLGKVRGALDAG